jgi:hypothetical protein
MLNMFGPFLPTILTFLRMVPMVGQLLKLPPVALILDALVGSSTGGGGDNDLVLGGLFALALSSVVYGYMFPPAVVVHTVTSSASSADESGMLLYVLLLFVVLGFGSLCAAYYYGWLDKITEVLKSSSPPGGETSSVEPSNISPQDSVPSLATESLADDSTTEAAGGEMDESKTNQDNTEAMDFLKSVPLVGSFFSLPGMSQVVGGKGDGADGAGGAGGAGGADGADGADGGVDEDDRGSAEKERKESLIKAKLDQLSSRRGKMAEDSVSAAVKKRVEWPVSLTVEELTEDLKPLMAEEKSDDAADASAATIDAEGLRGLSIVLTQGGSNSNSSSSKYAAELLPACHQLQSSEMRVGGIVGLMAVMQAQLLAGVLAAQGGDTEGGVGQLQQRMAAAMEEPVGVKSKGGKGKQEKGKAKGKAGESVKGAQRRLDELQHTLENIATNDTAGNKGAAVSAPLAWARPRPTAGGKSIADDSAEMNGVQERVGNCSSQAEYLEALRESFKVAVEAGGVTNGGATPDEATSADANGGANGDANGDANGGANGEGHLSVPVVWLDQAAQRATEARAAVDTYQDGKDISRDRVQINGSLYKGSEHGYNGILEALTAAVERALQDALGFDHDRLRARDRVRGRDVAVACGADGLRLGVGTGEMAAFARRVLSACNRTHSGGLSYEALEGLVRHPDFSLLVPDSMQASPLTIQLDAGPFRPPDASGPSGADEDEGAGSGWRWGVRATVTTCIPYKLTDPSACFELGAVKATFCTRIALDVGIGVEGNTNTEHDTDWKIANGSRAQGEAMRRLDAEAAEAAEAYCDKKVDLWGGQVTIVLRLFEQE